MRITILGASGKIGQLLTKELISRGHSVTALIHSKNIYNLTGTNFKQIRGDVHNLDDIRVSISDCDVIVSTLGSWGTKTKDIVSIAAYNVVTALDNKPSKRFVTLTGSAATLPNEPLTVLQKISRTMLKIISRRVLSDSEEHLKILSESKISWVSVRSPNMTNKKSTDYRLSLTPTPPWATVSRNAVVLAMIAIIETNKFSGQAPFISTK